MSRCPLKVMHLASGDRWAGAEVQLFTLLSELQKMPDIEPRAILLNEGELAKRLRERGVPVDILDESTLSSPTIFLRLIKLLRKHHPDMLHTHRLKENILGGLANALSIRVRSVRTVHGANENPPKRLHHRLIHALDLWTGNHLQQRIIAVSDDLAQKLRNNFSSEKIIVIENGVDIEAVRASVHPVEFRETEPSATHIGIVGRLDPVKRIDIFLDMAKLLIDEQPQRSWRFHVFGEGRLLTDLAQQAQRLSIDNVLTFHGHRSDIASCIAALDTLVMCSDHEGLPMTVLEALAIGTPMIAHAVGGLVDVLGGDAGGMLVSDHTGAGYASALIKLYALERLVIRDNGYQRVQEHYSAERNASS
ncbi:MAG TPA: glycosyltransferase, partial [Spongiibacteraceae bacterium]|nr:glycosyltransferase [Spongiibacteraceae bacterium]